MLGTSDAWSRSRSSHRPSDPAYYIEDCRISALTALLRDICQMGQVRQSRAAVEHKTNYQKLYKKYCGFTFIAKLYIKLDVLH